MNIGNVFLPLEMLDAIGTHFDVLTTLMASHVSKEFNEWAKRRGLPCDLSIRALSRMSASIGTADCLKYVYGLSSEYDHDLEGEVSIIAAFRGNIDVLKYVVSNSVATDFRDAATFALIGGQGECLNYLIEFSNGLFTVEDDEQQENIDLHSSLLRATACGLPDAVEVLLDMGASRDVFTRDTLCAEAAESGNLEILKLLHRRGFSCNASTASAAAYWGRASCLRYLIENGCIHTKDETLEEDAIWGGNQECIDMVLGLPPSSDYANRYGGPLFDDHSDPDEDEQEGITETNEDAFVSEEQDFWIY